MSLYAVIRDDLVESVHEWDGRSSWVTPSGTRLRGPVPAGCTRGWILSADGLGVEPPPPPPTIETARAAALTEVAALAGQRRSADAVVDGVPHHSDDTARTEWVYLAVGTLAQVGLGLLAAQGDPEAAAVLAALPPPAPATYYAADGTEQRLTSAAQVLGRYLGLLGVGVARREQALAATVAVREATTVDELETALDRYRRAA